MTFLLVNLILGLLAAAILQAAFFHLLDFRAQWFDTLFASLLTCGVSGATYFCANRVFDAGAGFGMLKVLGATFLLAYGVGLMAFRFMIKSEAGTFLSWRVSALVTLALSGPLILSTALLLAVT